MPYIFLTSQLTKPSDIVFIMGIAPQTEASKPTLLLFFFAKLKICLPLSAKRALFAVTTLFPFFKHSIMIDLAGSIPPINSTIISISGSLIKSLGLVVKAKDKSLANLFLALLVSHIFLTSSLIEVL